MKISPIKANQNQQSQSPAFMSRWMTKPWAIEQQFMREGVIEAEFHNNKFIANSMRKVADIYKKIFPNGQLPLFLEFMPFIDNAYGQYDPSLHMVAINSNLDCFKTKEVLQREMLLSKNAFFLPDEKSTTHYLRTFIHEFGHHAHHHNLEEREQGDAIYVFGNMRIPDTLGRFITKFKLGNYAASNMTEFMAERISKDICTRLDAGDNFIGNVRDLDYSNIFTNKWNCRYITPQSYLDYYTQQVWNGDIEGAGKTLKKMEEYMAAIDNGHRISAVEIERPRSGATLKQDSFLGRIDEFFGRIFGTSEGLDNHNKLKIDSED